MARKPTEVEDIDVTVPVVAPAAKVPKQRFSVIIDGHDHTFLAVDQLDLDAQVGKFRKNK